jgi:small GTP-binding protein
MSSSVVVFKFLVVGDHSVGKTSLLTRYVDNSHYDPRNTITTDFKLKKFSHQEHPLKIILWDSGTNSNGFKVKKFDSMLYRGTHAILLCFDLTNNQSFQNLNFWLKEISNHAPREVKIFLFGLKSDLNSEIMVNDEEIMKFTEENHLQYFSMSCLKSEKVFESMDACIHQIIDQHKVEIENFYQKIPEKEIVESSSCVMF